MLSQKLYSVIIAATFGLAGTAALAQAGAVGAGAAGAPAGGVGFGSPTAGAGGISAPGTGIGTTMPSAVGSGTGTSATGTYNGSAGNPSVGGNGLTGAGVQPSAPNPSLGAGIGNGGSPLNGTNGVNTLAPGSVNAPAGSSVGAGTNGVAH